MQSVVNQNKITGILNPIRDLLMICNIGKTDQATICAVFLDIVHNSSNIIPPWQNVVSICQLLFHDGTIVQYVDQNPSVYWMLLLRYIWTLFEYMSGCIWGQSVNAYVSGAKCKMLLIAFA